MFRGAQRVYMRETRDSRNVQRELVLLAGVLTLAAVLLLANLGGKSLWADETSTVRFSKLGFFTLWRELPSTDGHPPFHYLVWGLWMSLAGQSEFWLRFPAAVFALMTLPFLYLIARDLTDRKVALLATFLMGASPFFIMYGRMARYYSLVLLLATASSWLLLHLLKKFSWPKWAAYVVVSALALYTYYPSALVLAGHGAYIFVARHQHRAAATRAITGPLLAVALFLPWLSSALGSLGLHAPDVPVSDLARLGLSIVFLPYSFSLGETLYPWEPLAILGAALLLLLALGGLLSLQWKSRAVFIAILLGLAGPGLLLLTFMVELAPDVVSSRLIFLFPFFCLLVALGFQRIKRPPLRMALLGLIIIVFAVSNANYYLGRHFINPGYAQPTREIVGQVLQNSTRDELIVSSRDTPYLYYFELLRSPESARIFFLPKDDKERQAMLAFIKQDEPPAVWLIRQKRDYAQVESEVPGYREVQAFLDVSYTLEMTQGFLPTDRVYESLKHALLGSPTSEYRVLVSKYVRTEFW